MSASLTGREQELLGPALLFIQDYIESEGKLPTRKILRDQLRCKEESAGAVRNFLLETNADLSLKARKAANRSRHAMLVKNALLDKQLGDVPYEDQTEFLARENIRLHKALAKSRIESVHYRTLSANLAEGHSGFDELRERIGEVVSLMGDFKIYPSPVAHVENRPMPAITPGHSEDAVLVVSDSHWGDKIRREDMSGFPEFDLEIGANRWHYTVEKAKQILGIHRAAYPIDTLLVPVLGDIGNGSLYDAPTSNQILGPAQVVFSYHMLKFAIADLLELVKAGVVKKIRFLFSVGNHMRLTEWMPMKLQAQQTFDWLIYHMAIEHIKGLNNPAVEFREEFSPFLFEDIRGHRYCFTHGAQVHYHNNPEKQVKDLAGFVTLVRSMFDSPEYRKATGLEGQTFSRIVIGNIHVPINLPRIVTNGCLNGQNELGINWLLEPIPASQWIFGVSNRHEETWHYRIESTDVQRDGSNGYKDFANEFAARYGR